MLYKLIEIRENKEGSYFLRDQQVLQRGIIMSDFINSIQNRSHFEPQVTNNPVYQKKTNEPTEQELKDKFASADINPDTLDKIPSQALKYFTSGNKAVTMADSSITPDNLDDDIFHNIEKMIRSSESSIQIQMYNIYKKDIVNLLCEESKNGTKVQVITHTEEDERYPVKEKAINQMKEAGIEVLSYPIIPPGEKERYGNLMHVKLLIVDGNKAMIGGMNWGDNSPANRDFNVMVEGPAVDRMGRIFQEDWKFSGGNPDALPEFKKTPEHPEGDALVQVITSGPEPRQQTYEKTVLRAIDNAKKSIHTELFCITDRKVVEGLIKAKDRGVDVKVLAHPLKINNFAVNEKAVNQLKDAGVQVKWYVPDPSKRDNKLHGKAAIFDDDQAIIGSTNWTFSGFRKNREAGVEILSRSVNSALAEMFKDGWENHSSDEPMYHKKSADVLPGQLRADNI
jgi:cardiolipin synthase A/B